MPRRFLRIGMIASSLSCAALVAAWALSFFFAFYVMRVGHQAANHWTLYAGRLVWTYQSGPAIARILAHPATHAPGDWTFEVNRVDRRPTWRESLAFTTLSRRGANWSELWAIPLWVLILPLSIPTLLAWRSREIERHRKRAGLCPSCGYDLRATTARCPECGTVTVAK
jgi:hypothetical protein